MSKKQEIISVIGPNGMACTDEIYAFGEQLGKALAEHNYRIVCGGKGGLMEAVCRGARSVEAYQPGTTIGILPGPKATEANPYIDIAIPTGIGIARNQIVVNTGSRVIAVGGGAGTLSEIAFAWQLRKPILCVQGFGGASARMAGQLLDVRQAQPIPGANTLEEVLEWLKKPY